MSDRSECRSSFDFFFLKPTDFARHPSFCDRRPSIPTKRHRTLLLNTYFWKNRARLWWVWRRRRTIRWRSCRNRCRRWRTKAATPVGDRCPSCRRCTPWSPSCLAACRRRWSSTCPRGARRHSDFGRVWRNYHVIHTHTCKARNESD